MKKKQRIKKERVPCRLVALSALSGLLMFAAFTVEKLDLLAFVALVPMITALRVYKDGGFGTKKCFFVYAAAYYLPNMLWLYRMCPMTNYGIPAVPSYLIMTAAIITIAAAEGFVFTVAFLPFDRLRGTKIPMFVLFPVLYVFAEFLQAHAWELSFPWGRLGTVVASHPTLIQTASLFGSLGVSLIVAFFNALTAETAFAIIRTKSYKRAALYFLSAALLFSLNAAYGAVRVSAVEKERGNSETVKVAVVQANLGSMTKWDTSLSESIEKYVELSDSVADEKPDIYLWPETAVTTNMSNENVMAFLKNFAKERNATLVTGIFNGEHGEYNALTAIRADGQVPQPYYKRELVPMGEYIPLSDVLSVFVPANFGNLVAGTEPTTLDTSFGTAGGLICYESIYPYVAREDVEAGAEYFLMVSNDSWFDGSAALRQHLCHAVMRCVENGRDMARAGNTGISAVISASGTIEKKSNADAEEVLVSDIVPTTERTLYSYIGDLIALPLAGLYAFGIFLMIRSFILKIIAKKREKETISHNV